MVYLEYLKFLIPVIYHERCMEETNEGLEQRFTTSQLRSILSIVGIE
jgi:hypothetical protein